MSDVDLLGHETFLGIRELMHDTVGLAFPDSKKPLISSRLMPRMRRLGIERFEDYFALISADVHGDEFQTAVDLLTTNETYFFREPAHFRLLEAELAREHPLSLSVWSAAASYGDEAYSVAMLLSELQHQGRIGNDWKVLGTDISDRVLRSASEAVFPVERLRQVTADRRRRHTLRGEGESEGLVLMNTSLRARVRFAQLNLCLPIGDIGPFDVIFLRNVLIYFDGPTKRAVVDRVLTQLRPGGLFFIGTAEGRVACDTPLTPLAPGAFRKVAG